MALKVVEGEGAVEAVLVAVLVEEAKLLGEGEGEAEEAVEAEVEVTQYHSQPLLLQVQVVGVVAQLVKWVGVVVVELEEFGWQTIVEYARLLHQAAVAG